LLQALTLPEVLQLQLLPTSAVAMLAGLWLI